MRTSTKGIAMPSTRCVTTSRAQHGRNGTGSSVLGVGYGNSVFPKSRMRTLTKGYQVHDPQLPRVLTTVAAGAIRFVSLR